MRIGEVARRSGVGVETVRFYERRGLLVRPPRPQRGFRSYPAETVARIRFIREAQAVGFSLEEIRELLELRADPAADCARVRRRAQAKLAQLDAKLRLLLNMRRALELLVSACPGEGPVERCTILEAISRARAHELVEAES